MFGKNLAIFVAVTVALTFACHAAEAQYVKDGLLGYWPLDTDSISGDTIKDVSGNGNDGTINFPVKIVAGQVGDALEFDGENGHSGKSRSFVDQHRTRRGWYAVPLVHTC